jgi:hypothetical protein
MLKRLHFYFPDFPTKTSAWQAIDDRWATAQQHESRQPVYRVEPYSLRSIANYAVTGLGFRQANVSRDRHADPIGEMIHISALEGAGQQVQVGSRRDRYAPANLVQVLQVVEETYSGAEVRLDGPDIHVVDWSGREFDPALPHDQQTVRKVIADARGRAVAE